METHILMGIPTKQELRHLLLPERMAVEYLLIKVSSITQCRKVRMQMSLEKLMQTMTTSLGMLQVTREDGNHLIQYRLLTK
nr:MAG TPA: hypothetical protein [Bacteriophage sp.]